MITRLSTALSALLLCLCILKTAQAQQPPQVSDVFREHVNMLNELSERRQVNRYFSNEQSIFYGAQTGFVNAGTGNLTFIRRDLVTVGRMPIVMARVYDSGLVNSGLVAVESDFSAGWQLSLAQTIEVMDNGTLLYRDDSAVLNQFIPATVGYKINPAQNSDIKSIGFNGQGLIQIDYLTGWSKQFQKLGNKYRLVNIADNNANQLTLSYIDNRLSSITAANNRAVIISRDETGRIVKISDDISRSVSYGYDKNQLVSVNDLAGHHWQYQYYGNHLLHTITDPLGQKAATFSFGKDNKATVVKIRAKKHRYKYQGNTTRVTDEDGNITTLVQNDKGITTSITNAEGFTSSIVLNDRHQITELWHNDNGVKSQQAHITYDDNGRPSQYDINGKPTALEQLKQDHYQQFSYQYDGSGRVISIDGTISDRDKTHIRYAYDTRGNLTRHQQTDFTRTYQYAANGDVLSETEIQKETQSGQSPVKTSFSYSEDGLLTSLNKLQKTSHFGYNSAGKLNDITFPDGQSHQYTYDSLGFRSQTKRSDNSHTSYQYDNLGNLKKSTKTPSTTTANQQVITENHSLNGQNQLVDSQTTGREPLTIKYGAKGNPKSIIRGNKASTYQYDKLGRLTGVNDSEQGLSSHEYKPGETDIRLQLDDRTRPENGHQSKVGGHNQNQSQLHYARINGSPWRTVVWDADQAKLLVASPETLNSADTGYQSSKQRRRLYNAIAVNQWSQHSFDKASNSFFTPPEYSAIGCEIEEERCYGVMNYVTLTMPSNITVGDTVRFVARAGGNSACAAMYYFAFQNFYATNNTGVFDVPVTSAGTFNAVASAECCSYMKFVSKPVSVAAPNSCPASISGSAKPVNFREVSGKVQADGTLFFEYRWDSSNGNLVDLEECDVAEHVIYPDTNNPYILPSPWTHSVDNPTVNEHLASDGSVRDRNKKPVIAKPYKEAEFKATQRFKYRCPCINGGEWIFFILKTPEPIGYNIHRAIKKNADGSYRYEITKSNKVAKVNPLP